MLQTFKPLSDQITVEPPPTGAKPMKTVPSVLVANVLIVCHAQSGVTADRLCVSPAASAHSDRRDLFVNVCHTADGQAVEQAAETALQA
jgi:hypothetical protein